MLKILIFILITSNVNCFIPSKIINFILANTDSKFNIDLGYESETLVHEEIIKRGILRSVAKYFRDQPDGMKKINLNKLNTDYLHVKNIYNDYYGKKICNSDFDDLIHEFKENVASIDYDKDTKDLPYAHFDAETFKESNDRVIKFMTIINSFLSVKDYKNARLFSGKIMHTIQDFYSHSNWIEMGNHNKINTLIGTEAFNSMEFNKKNDNLTCVSNCTIIKIKCHSLFRGLAAIASSIGHESASFKCPIKYFKCKGNIAKTNKLVSGFYVNQALPDGTIIAKPNNLLKCSHGGILDGDSYKTPLGGINKDSGYYLFSPHADLHLMAANLAINHTEHFFEQIRKQIGNEEYANFLKLKITDKILKKFNSLLHKC